MKYSYGYKQKYNGSAQGNILDSVNADAVYSLRDVEMGGNYSGPAIRVMKDDLTTLDVNASQINDGTINTFCGASVGRVNIIYDRSGNARHIEQSTFSNMPLIYNGSAVVTDNGKPAMSFSGVEFLFGSYSLVAKQVYVVCNGASDILRFSGASRFDTIPSVYAMTSSAGNLVSAIPLDTQVILEYDNENIDFYIDGTLEVDGSVFTQTFNRIDIGGSGSFIGTIQEIMFFSTESQSLNRSILTADIDNYFQII